MADKDLAINTVTSKDGVAVGKPELQSNSSFDMDIELEKRSVEKGTTVQLKRRLQSRHLQMIAIGTLETLPCYLVTR